MWKLNDEQQFCLRLWSANLIAGQDELFYEMEHAASCEVGILQHLCV